MANGDDNALSGSITYDQRNALNPSWWNNPVGTERLNEQSLTMPSGAFDPIVDPSVARWPGRPMTLSEYQGLQRLSLDLFNQTAAIDTGGARMPEPVLLAATRRGRGGRLPPPVPEVSPGPVIPAQQPTISDLPAGVREGTMAAVPSLRTMTPAEASVQAATGAHLIQNSDGTYVGAPSSVRSPADLQAMRDRFDDLLDRGVHGRDWYATNRNWISEVTGTQIDPATGAVTYGNPNTPNAFAQGLALTSPESNPNTNLQFFLRAWNPYMRGTPSDIAKNRTQAAQFNMGMQAREAAEAAGANYVPNLPGLGPKTEPYSVQLSPTQPFTTTPVNDIWHARAFGYTDTDGSEFSGSPTDQQHKFMDYETVLAKDRANARNAGGFSDWNIAQTQAAPWVAGKEEGLARQHPDWSPERIRAEATATYQEFAPGVTGYMPHEQAFGSVTGLKEYYDRLTPDQQRLFNLSTWANRQTGRDILTGNMFPQPRMQPTIGTYINAGGQFESNPAMTAHPLLDFLPAPEKGNPPRAMPQSAKDVLDASSYVRAAVDAQEGNGWHYIDTRPDRPLGERTSMRLDTSGMNQPPTREQLAALTDVAHKDGFFTADTGNGISLLNASRSAADTPEGMRPSPVDGKELKARLNAGLQDDIQRALPGARITTGHATMGYAYLGDVLDKAVAGQGQTVTRMLEEVGKLKESAPDAYNDMVNNPDIAAKAQRNLARMTPAMRRARPDYARMLDIIGKGGLPALMKRITKYGAAGLPAALLALDQGEDEDQ